MNTPTLQMSPMPTDPTSSFFVRLTFKMSRAPRRYDRTDGQARRLHFVVRPRILPREFRVNGGSRRARRTKPDASPSEARHCTTPRPTNRYAEVSRDGRAYRWRPHANTSRSGRVRHALEPFDRQGLTTVNKRDELRAHTRPTACGSCSEFVSVRFVSVRRSEV